VLQHELPVPPVGVPEDAARHLDLAVGRALDEIVERRAERTEESGERRAVLGHRREQKTSIGVDARHTPKPAARRLARRTLVAARQRQAHEAAVGSVRPAVICAHELGRGPGRRLAHARAAMGAAVDEHVHRAVAVARHDDGLAPHARREEIAGAPHLALVTEDQPRAAKDPVHLELEDLRIGVDGAVDELARLTIGEDRTQVEAITAKLRRAAGSSGPGGIFTLALSAVDIACWDLKGKAMGQSVCALLGGLRDRVTTYASGALMRP